MNYGGGSTAGPNDLSLENGNEMNVLTNGLMYPIRIETGSMLKSSGEGGEQIGAEIMYRYGQAGTLWGEAEFNTLADEDLWPFPNESVIRERMRVYNRWDPYDSIDPDNPSNPDTYVKGDRGFCADGQTLTKYIWEYLGNPIPPEIYGEADNEPPFTSGHSPTQNTTGFYGNSNIVVHIQDSGEVVDQSSITMTVNGQTVNPVIEGSPSDLTVAYIPPTPFNAGETFTVLINAHDQHNPANVMPEESYTFTIAGLRIIDVNP